MKTFIKSRKGKIIIGIVFIVLTALAVVSFNKYNYELNKPHVIFNDEVLELGMSQDPMTLLKTWKAEKIDCCRYVDTTGNVTTEVTKTGEYMVYFTATNKGISTEFKKKVNFTDDIPPVLENVVTEVEMDYGIEFNPEGNVKAIDNVDGEVEVLINIVKYPENPQRIDIEYLAKDAAGNESSASSIINVKAPACALNATFSWEEGDCGCNAGYTGDGWSACSVAKKSTTTKTTASSGNKTAGNTSTSSSGSNYNLEANNSSGSGNGWNSGSWYVDIPSQEAIDRVHAEGNAKYGEGNSWGAGIDSEGNITNWWN